MNGRRILLVDDKQDIIDGVAYALRQHAFEVQGVLTAAAALRAFRERAPDLVLLDLQLPDMSGLDVLKEMRRLHPAIPIVIVSALVAETDRVVGLELGADDYVTKPFSARELVARVKAHLRRPERAPAQPPESRLSYGPIEMDVDALTFSYFGRPTILTRAEFRFLECLLRFPAQVFTRDLLINRLYDGEHVVTDRVIDACVRRLRKKLAEIRPGADPVQTVFGLGYKMNHDIEGLR